MRKMGEVRRDCLSVYFKDRTVIDRLRRLSTVTGKSVSAIVDAVMAGALPLLEKRAPKAREFDVVFKVRI